MMTKEEIEQRAAERFPYMSNDMPERVRTLSLRQAYITGYQQASVEVERLKEALAQLEIKNTFLVSELIALGYR